MNPQIMVKELIKEVKEMPQEDVKTVLDFVEYLREKEIEEEILSDKKLISEVKRSQNAWKNKKTNDFVSLDKIKKNNV